MLGVFGLIIGSYLHLAAMSVLNKESIALLQLHCVHCKQPLRAFERIPVLGFLMLKGRCRTCGARISRLYPIGEAATAFIFAWIGWHFGPYNPEWASGLLLASILIVITHTDLRTMKIPNVVVFTGAAMAVVLRAFIHPLPYWNYAAAAAIGFGLLYLLAVASRGGIGGGDMKLYVFIGLMLGVSATLLSLFLASLLGAVYGLATRLSGRLRPKQPIPFGPFIAVGTLLSFLYGDRWIEMYLEWLLL